MNDNVWNQNSTEDASKRIDSVDKIDELCQNYQQIDPYVKAILIQSVIFLDNQKFNEVEQAYHRLIEKAENDNDMWVQRTAKIFKNYPNLEIPDDFVIQGPLVEDNNFIDPFKAPEFVNETHKDFHCEQMTIPRPPSESIEPPKAIDPRSKDIHREQQMPKPSMQQPIRPPDANHQQFQPPIQQIPKPEKKEKKVLPMVPPPKQEKIPIKVEQPKKEKKTKKVISF